MSDAVHAFRPDYAIAPGETLRDRLTEMNLSQAELAARAGISTKHVNQIMQGNAPITLETAVVLERITGVPASFWNRREADYREALLRSKPNEERNPKVSRSLFSYAPPEVALSRVEGSKDAVWPVLSLSRFRDAVVPARLTEPGITA